MNVSSKMKSNNSKLYTETVIYLMSPGLGTWPTFLPLYLIISGQVIPKIYFSHIFLYFNNFDIYFKMFFIA